MNYRDSLPCYYIGRRLRWAGIRVDDEKEKYGQWRVYCNFGLDSITILDTIILPIQQKWYRHVYRMALRKFPTEAEGILMGASYSELILGLDSRYVCTEIDNITHITWESGA